MKKRWLIKWKRRGENWDRTEEYRAVIEEYELMLKSENEGFIPNKWEYIYNALFYIGKRDGILYYALADLSGDGYPELIIGRKWDTKNWGSFLCEYLSLSYREEDVALKTVEDTSTVKTICRVFLGRKWYGVLHM